MKRRALLIVRYRFIAQDRHFREEMAKAAPQIAAIPGMIWKIWGFDPRGGAGLSAYLFETVARTEAFLEGAAITGLRHHAMVADVVCELATIDDELSLRTGAAAALAAPPDRLDREGV